MFEAPVSKRCCQNLKYPVNNLLVQHIGSKHPQEQAHDTTAITTSRKKMQVLCLKDRTLIKETKKRKRRSYRMRWDDEKMRRRKRKGAGDGLKMFGIACATCKGWRDAEEQSKAKTEGICTYSITAGQFI